MPCTTRKMKYVLHLPEREYKFKVSFLSREEEIVLMTVLQSVHKFPPAVKADERSDEFHFYF